MSQINQYLIHKIIYFIITFIQFRLFQLYIFNETVEQKTNYFTNKVPKKRNNIINYNS